MDVVFSVCIVRRGAVGARCFVMQMFDVTCVHPAVVLNAA